VSPDLLELLRAGGIRLATAESCTGGMIAAALTDLAGSSTVFMGGIVTYSNAAKTALLGVPDALLDAHGAVSEQVARAMAEGALRAVPEATMAVSVTGIAGPGGSEFKPEGRVCFGLAMTGRETWVETVEFGPLGRAQVRSATRDHALAMIHAAL
jgi:nicotinamide-nucleotide amidase